MSESTDEPGYITATEPIWRWNKCSTFITGHKTFMSFNQHREWNSTQSTDTNYEKLFTSSCVLAVLPTLEERNVSALTPSP